MRPAERLGPVLAGRGPAEALRADIETSALSGDALSGHEVVVVDFTGVEAMSPSFADELFAKLPPEVLRRVRFENLDEDSTALARFVIAGRTPDASPIFGDGSS